MVHGSVFNLTTAEVLTKNIITVRLFSFIDR